MTIQSRSPRRSLDSEGTSAFRWRAMLASAEVLMRIEGRWGGSSRMVRWTAARPSCRSFRVSKGVVPVRSS